MVVRVLALLLGILLYGVSEAQPAAQPKPQVTIAVPTPSSTVSGQLRVTGDIAHTKPVVKTELLVGGSVVATSAGGASFSFLWDAAKARRGKHTLTVQVYDAEGRIGRSEVQVQVRSTFNVKQFSARGDGKADDTKAIQATLEAARKAGGGSVYLPKGTYLISPRAGAVFAVGSNIEIRGDGPASVVKIGNDAGDYNYVFGQLNAELDFPLVENVAFREFRVDQNPSGNRTADIREGGGIQNVIQLHTFKNVTVQGVHFDPEPGVQAVVLDTQKTDAGGAVIDGCLFRFVRGRSTLAHKYDNSSVYTEARNVLIRNNVFQAEPSQCAITAIEVHGGPDVIVRGNRTEGFAGGVIVVNATPQYKDVPEGRFVVCNNRFQQTTQGVALWSNRGRVLRNVIIRDNEITMGRHELYTDVWLGVYLYHSKDAATDGEFEKIEIAQNKISFEKLKTGSAHVVGIDLGTTGRVKDVLVKGNTILASPARGIHLGNPAARGVLQDVRVEANTIVDAGWDTNLAGPSRAAIVLDKVPLTNVQIHSNILRDTGKPGAPRGRFAVWAYPAAASNGVMLRANQVLPPGALRDDIDRTKVEVRSTAP